MEFDYSIRYGSKSLRCGYTTGSCAALAAKAAVEWMLSGTCPKQASIMTYLDIPLQIGIEGPRKENGVYCCSVRKYAGDDPDITDGMLISAAVSGMEEPGVQVDGGEGIGRVTKPGLDQPVGAAAINHVPRRMIRENVLEVCRRYDYEGGIRVVISAPEGAELAKSTFNPQIGIVGGISILGTTGIVHPMSEKAMIDVMEMEARQAAVCSKRLILVPGNYGMNFLKEQGYLWDNVPAIRYSGYFGEALDIAASCGFKEVLVVSHVGKLVKTAGGIMNTHQKKADCRMELFCAHAAVNGADTETCRSLMNAATTDACIEILDKTGLREAVIGSLLQAIGRYITRRVDGAYRVGAVMFSNVYGILGMTEGTEGLLHAWSRNQY